MIALQITSAGGVQMLQDDAVDLGKLGKIKVSRASNVEYANADSFEVEQGDIKEGWFVQSCKTSLILKDGFKTRAAALAWEKKHYSPSGKGWAELTGKEK